MIWLENMSRQQLRLFRFRNATFVSRSECFVNVRKHPTYVQWPSAYNLAECAQLCHRTAAVSIWRELPNALCTWLTQSVGAIWNSYACRVCVHTDITSWMQFFHNLITCTGIMAVLLVKYGKVRQGWLTNVRIDSPNRWCKVSIFPWTLTIKSIIRHWMLDCQPILLLQFITIINNSLLAVVIRHCLGGDNRVNESGENWKWTSTKTRTWSKHQTNKTYN